MNSAEVNDFYDKHVRADDAVAHNFVGHFDFLLWENLREDKDACMVLQRKPFYKITLLQGQAAYESGGQQIQISGNTLVFSSPLSRFSFTTNDDTFDGKYCVCSEDFLRGTSRLYVRNWPVFKDRGIYTKTLDDKEYADVLHIFNEIEREYKSDYALKEELVRNRVFDIIHYAQKFDTNPSEMNYLQEESLENRFFKLLENSFINISPAMPLEDKSPAYFADLLFTTVHQLNKTIKETTGKTTLSFIHERILEEANVLLKHSTFSMKEIAYSLHFLETSHFQNFYKKRTNRTPAEYREA